MAYPKKLEFGNYTLKFGEKMVLLDLFDEIVMPSFFEMKYIRTLKGKGEYFFIDTELVRLDDDANNPAVGITGRIVKNTKLRREQIFKPDGGLLEDISELDTAPSSMFLLVLNSHRLILCKEVPGAPTIKNFQSTSQYCLRQRHKEFIGEQYEELNSNLSEDDKKVTKRSIVDSNPFPFLRITPLSDKQNLKEFVSRFQHIDKVSIKLLPTNDEEINNDDFWSDLGRRREDMNSKAARVEFSNPKDGLDSDEVYAQAVSASGLGNSEVAFKGQDKQGDTIRGNNDDFSLTVEADELPRNAKRAAAVSYVKFMSLAQAGIIALPQLAETTLVQIKRIFDRL